jgi:hypothetical protein
MVSPALAFKVAEVKSATVETFTCLAKATDMELAATKHNATKLLP